MTIFLIGMPGVGKSYWLKKLRQKYQCVATDLDLFIEIREQQRVAEIFATKGEAYFREREAQALRSVTDLHSDKDLHIISTGGGTPCSYDNTDFMLENGLMIYLKAKPEFIKSRLEQAKVVRPLIEKVPESERLVFLSELLQKRRPFYERAHLSVDALSARLPIFAAFLEQYKIYPQCTNKQ